MSCAVTRTVIAFAPSLSVMAPLSEPLETAVPCTVTVAVESATVGVSFACVLAFATVAV